MAFEAEALHQVVHAVEATQHGALAAAGRPDETGDLVLADRHMAVANGHEIAVEDLVQLAVHDDGGFADHGSGFWRSGYVQGRMLPFSILGLAEYSAQNVDYQHDHHQYQRGRPGELELVVEWHAGEVVDQYGQ